MKKWAQLILFFLLLGAQVVAQDTSSNAPPDEEVLGEPEETSQTYTLPLSRYEFQLSLFVLSFGFLLILLEIYLIRSKKITAEDTIKFIVITLIIISTLFLITAGYSNDQIAPAVGLLGTIAGYLLGKINSNKKEDEKV